MNDVEREKLILENMWIVNYIAKKYSSDNNQLLEELKSVGNIGLIKAVDHYNNQMGTLFSTYATLLIQGEIRHYLRDNSNLVRIPRKYVSYYQMIQEAIAQYLITNARKPKIQEIQEMTGLSKKIIIESLEAGYAKYPTSIDESINFDGNDLFLKDTLEEEKDEITTALQKISINHALKKLDSVERKSIVLKYKQDLTIQEIAKKLQINSGKVNRSIKTGIEKLRSILEKQEK